MKVARHPLTHQSVTIPEYRKEFGPPNRGTIKLSRPPATCPACHQPLFIRGESVVQDRQTFAHFPVSEDRSAVFCPIKLAGKHKYSVLCPTDHDPVLAKQLKDSFFENWKVHWRRFMRYVGYADVSDFIDVLRVADKANVWGYRAIKEHEVIVALMLISDFKPVLATKAKPPQPLQVAETVSAPTPDVHSQPPQQLPEKPLRENWIRFWFESGPKNFEDFWNLPLKNKVIIRVEYAVPEDETKLKPEYLDSYDVIDVSYDYLANRRTGDDVVAPIVESRMKRAFKKYLSE